MPAEFTAKWWKKHRALTLKSTGLADLLQDYEDTLDKLQGLAKAKVTGEGMKAFDDGLDLVGTRLPAGIKKAQAACNKTLHKDTIAILAEYQKTCLPKAAGAVTNLHKDYCKAQASRMQEMIVACDKSLQIAAGAQQVASDAFSNARRLINDSDALLMKLTDALGASDDGLAKSTQAKLREVAKDVAKLHTDTVAAIKKAREDSKKSWDYDAAVFPPGKNPMARQQDKVTNQFDAADMAAEKIEPLIAEAQDNVAEGISLESGKADLSKIYLKSAQRAAESAKSNADRVSGGARDNGGKTEAVVFDFMNAEEKKDPTHLANEIKRLTPGVVATVKQSQTLKDACIKALADLKKSLTGFPAFVQEDVGNFGEYFEQMRKSRDEIEESLAEAEKNLGKLKKLAQKIATAKTPVAVN